MCMEHPQSVAMPKSIDCWVEAKDRRVVRIFKNTKAAMVASVDGVLPFFGNREEAIEQIRWQVFERDNWTCVHCGRKMSWYVGELDEKISRGQGGEISVENGQTLCHVCHVEKHGRVPKFGEHEKV